MTIYPQSLNGSVCQFPYKKTLQYRTIMNVAEDGSRIALEDSNASAVRWTLNYSGLTDTELVAFQSFFAAVNGRLRSFTFLDPSSNLLTWSEDFSQTAWQKSTFLQSQTGIGDPLGTQRATSLMNSGAGDLTLVQSIPIPGSYLCCFSFFVECSNPSTITLTRGNISRTVAISSSWRRVFLATTTSDGTDTSTFGVTIPAGQQINVFGMQVEAQPASSTYIQTLDRSGVYPTTRFDSDSLSVKSDAPNSNTCEVKLYSKLARSNPKVRNKMNTVFQTKELAVTDSPFLVFDCTLADGTEEHWSTQSVTVGSIQYSGRVMKHNLFESQTASDQSVDSMPRLVLELANADSHFSELERSVGFKGATLVATFVFMDLPSGNPTTETKVVFQGILNPAELVTENSFRLSADESSFIATGLPPSYSNTAALRVDFSLDD